MTRTPTPRNLRLAILALALAGCAHSAPATVTAAPAVPDARVLAYDAIGCWMGPVWDDALGAPPDARLTRTQARCHDVVMQTWGARDPKSDLERLRALEDNAVRDLKARVAEAARAQLDPATRRDLLLLVDGVAAVQRENMNVRRAADRVKLDVTGERTQPQQKLPVDERAAQGVLLDATALDRLSVLDAGALRPDARALARLSALDRVRAAGGLPRHLEIYAAEPAFRLLFGVAAPTVAADPTVEVAPRVWIGYLTTVAQAAGYPVPTAATSAEERDRLAWAGMLDGAADKLAATAVSEELRPVIDGAVRRLRAEALGGRNGTLKDKP